MLPSRKTHEARAAENNCNASDGSLRNLARGSRLPRAVGGFGVPGSINHRSLIIITSLIIYFTGKQRQTNGLIGRPAER